MQPTEEISEQLLEYLSKSKDSMVELLEELVAIESPTMAHDAQLEVFQAIERHVGLQNFRYRCLPVERSAGVAVYFPPKPDEPCRVRANRKDAIKVEQDSGAKESRRMVTGRENLHRRRSPWNGKQLILGHVDTVWPIGTLQQMPLRRVNQQLYGPGVFDMKGGIVQAVFAIKALHECDLLPTLQPILLLNSEEEVGSPNTRELIKRFASCCDRVFVLEPPVGSAGLLKTERKGGGFFRLKVKGRAAHAGLNPDEGRNAIERMLSVLHRLQALGESYRQLRLNLGQIQGGVAANVVAPNCEVVVDVRAASHDELMNLKQQLLKLPFAEDGMCLTIDVDLDRPPMERNERNQELWFSAQRIAQHLGISLKQTSVGGGSDGNFTSPVTATLDGLGAVGSGAHQTDEHVLVDEMPKRSTLLATLLLEPNSRCS